MSSSDDSFRIWMLVSRVQFWLILVFIMVSFIVIFRALYRLIQLRRSVYFQFLFSIIIAYLITLFTILFDVSSQSLFFSIKGPVLCKVLVFVSNVAACFANWTWLVMFLQRCVLLLYPLRNRSKGLIGFAQKPSRLLMATLLLATTTQSWSLLLITERQHMASSTVVATTCERDTQILSDEGYKWVALLEALSTYVCPFLCTMVLDLGVLVWRQQSTSFSVVSSDNVRKKESNRLLIPKEGLKIQSSESIKHCTKRRQKAIRRCLIMATVQVILNAPYYLLQLIDELYSLQASKETFIAYVYADALLYFLYLCQFPLITVYISTLKSDSKRPSSHPHSPASIVRKTPRISTSDMSNGRSSF